MTSKHTAESDKESEAVSKHVGPDVYRWQRALDAAREIAHDLDAGETRRAYHHFVVRHFGGCYHRAAAFADEMAQAKPPGKGAEADR
jgi:hypothetical protein